MYKIFAIVLLIVNRIFCHREPVVPEILTEENKDKEEENKDKEDKEPVIEYYDL
jgi:hypothetical protein